MRTNLFFLSILMCGLSYAKYDYPLVKKNTQTERRFGVEIKDDFKWMENASDPDLWDWIEEQQALTTNFLDKKLTQDFYLDLSMLRKDIKAQESGGAKLITAKPSHAPLFRPDEKEIKDESVKEKYTIEAQDVQGGDLSRVKIFDKSSGKLKDIILVKFFELIKWSEDGEELLYITDGDERTGAGRPRILKHKVGEAQSEDELIYKASKINSELSVFESQDKTTYIMDTDFLLAFDFMTKSIQKKFKLNGKIIFPESLKSHNLAYTLSFEKENNGEIYSLNLSTSELKLVVPAQDFVLQELVLLSNGDSLVLGHRDGSSELYHLKDGMLQKIPGLQDGFIELLSTEDLFKIKIRFQSYSTPKTIYELDLFSKELKQISQLKYPVEVEAEKVYYTATNGQKAAMWVLKKKGTALTEKTPMILYGYGGFFVNQNPSYNPFEILPWLNRGGAMAVVVLPGALEYGYEWNKFARKGGRINSFDSFANAGKELISRGMTSEKHLGMFGGSNGGLLVAGTLERHPDLFKAAVPMVGVLDLLNFNLFTAGKYWVEEYGQPFTPNDFKELLAISPYHNLKPRNYPSVMVMTAEFDDRVVPMHSFKYAAKLQEMQQGDAPILLYTKEWGGHSRKSGSERQSLLMMSAIYTFFGQELGLN